MLTSVSRNERDEWTDTIKRHVRVEMMKKLNFPFVDWSLALGNGRAEVSRTVEKGQGLTDDARRKEDKLKQSENSDQSGRVDEELDEPEEIEACTITILGGGGVGKSSLITRFLKDDFYDEDTADPTLQDEYSGRITIDGRERKSSCCFSDYYLLGS